VIRSSSAQSAIDTLQQSATRRSFVYIFVPTLFIILITALGESDQWTHALDDEIIVLTALAVLIYFLISRRASTSSQLARINRVGVIASAIVVAAGVLAVLVEFHDPADIGDDPVTVVAGVLAVINGLLIMAAAGPRVPEEAASYAVEWTRVRTSFWFSTFFVVTFITFVIPPYPAYSVGALLAWAEVAALLIAGIAGLLLLVWSRHESNPATLRTYNNVIVGLAILLSALALLQFDIGTLAFSVVLIANRFL
jgi:hypothetical protein